MGPNDLYKDRKLRTVTMRICDGSPRVDYTAILSLLKSHKEKNDLAKKARPPDTGNCVCLRGVLTHGSLEFTVYHKLFA